MYVPRAMSHCCEEQGWSLNYLLLNEVLRTKSEQKQYGGKERVDSFKLGIAHRYIF